MGPAGANPYRRTREADGAPLTLELDNCRRTRRSRSCSGGRRLHAAPRSGTAAPAARGSTRSRCCRRASRRRRPIGGPRPAACAPPPPQMPFPDPIQLANEEPDPPQRPDAAGGPRVQAGWGSRPWGRVDRRAAVAARCEADPRPPRSADAAAAAGWDHAAADGARPCSGGPPASAVPRSNSSSRLRNAADADAALQQPATDILILQMTRRRHGSRPAWP